MPFILCLTNKSVFSFYFTYTQIYVIKTTITSAYSTTKKKTTKTKPHLSSNDQPFVLFAIKPVESLSDDFLFPMTTSRLSYASSPESDLELSPGPSASLHLSLGNLPQLVKSSSDPSIATNQDALDRSLELVDTMPPPYTVSNLISICVHLGNHFIMQKASWGFN